MSLLVRVNNSNIIEKLNKKSFFLLPTVQIISASNDSSPFFVGECHHNPMSLQSFYSPQPISTIISKRLVLYLPPKGMVVAKRISTVLVRKTYALFSITFSTTTSKHPGWSQAHTILQTAMLLTAVTWLSRTMALMKGWGAQVEPEKNLPGCNITITIYKIPLNVASSRNRKVFNSEDEIASVGLCLRLSLSHIR